MLFCGSAGLRGWRRRLGSGVLSGSPAVLPPTPNTHSVRISEVNPFGAAARAGHTLNLLASGQDQGDVVRLFVGADPVVDRSGYDFADPGKRLEAMLPYQVDQALFAEFSEVIFRLGHAIAEGKKEFSPSQRDRRVLIKPVIE